MKIVATFAFFGAAVHVGGDVERESCIIEIPDESLPKLLKDHIKNSEYQTLSLSILKD